MWYHPHRVYFDYHLFLSTLNALAGILCTSEKSLKNRLVSTLASKNGRVFWDESINCKKYEGKVLDSMGNSFNLIFFRKHIIK